MWECPFFVPLPGGRDTHILCVSPYPHHLKERPTNPVLFWLSAFQSNSFDVSKAQGDSSQQLGVLQYRPSTLSSCCFASIMCTC